MATQTTNYNLSKPEATDPFSQFRQSYNDNMDIIDANLGGGGGSGGHTIYDPDGNALAQESGLQFTGAVSVSDDNVNGRTVVDIKGNSLILDAQIYTDTEKVVGVWRDKKPLYQKTVNFGSLPANNSSKTVAHGISDIETLANAVFVVQSSTQFRTLPNVSRGNTANQTVWYMTATDIGVLTGSSADVGSAYSGYVTIWYTKTTDVAGSGGYEAYGFSPVIYSDVERVIGVWRDNKPLYQRTFDLGSDISISNTSWYSAIVSITNVENITHCFGLYSGGTYYPLMAYHTGDNVNVLACRANSGATVRYLTLCYTKTTDVAGSGDYNTYGVPTVHYSTSEQVIGTWTNGKPRYQITLEGSGSYPSGTELVVALPNDADKVVIMGGYADIGSDWLPIQLTLGLGTPSTNGIYCYPNKTTGLHIYSSAWTFTEYSVTVQYCKTTD